MACLDVFGRRGGGGFKMWRGGAGHEREKGRSEEEEEDSRMGAREDEGRRVVLKELSGCVVPGRPRRVFCSEWARRGESGLKIKNCLSCTLDRRERAHARGRSTA